ncbi:MAG: aminopeptidase [Lachnospiraceae bacterium]|nr:aminopeptidase [Lachnospiraceae bacterium]
MIEERFLLAVSRIKEITKEMEPGCGIEAMPEPFCEYFGRMADFLILMADTYHYVEAGELYLAPVCELKERNRRLYEDILPENYGRSFANPEYSASKLGEDFGRLLSFLYAELRSLIVFAHEKRQEEMVIRMELFLEIYGSFLCSLEESGKIPDYEAVRESAYFFVSDYTREAFRCRLNETLNPEADFALRIMESSDLKSPEYLYYFGEYITEDELGTWEHLSKLPGETIKLMADTYTEGYRIGFLVGNKDISKKKTVNIRYCLGFERMIKQAVENFEQMGLKSVIYRAASGILQGKGLNRTGYYGAVPNRQYDYDHKDDIALFLDRNLVRVRMEAWQEAYEEFKTQAALFGGPAVVEVFGEEPPDFTEKKEAPRLDETQQKLSVEYAAAVGELQNRYIKGEERSFTIIAFPTPKIGKDYPEIFDEVIRINTLDYALYQSIQQKMIDALDKGKYVLIKGRGRNRTNLKVMLHPLADPERQTNFENCAADVNIPVGEVFTSPQLAGTEGVLHVTRVFLNGLEYRDLCLVFEDGRIKEYDCKSFDTPEENRKYIKDNLLFHHDTLPLGEFAIGTNTAAYVAGRKYRMEDRLPILIAEKTGPHFAVGDTCYSHGEDVTLFNPDGKEIIAKDNEHSLLRRTQPKDAYFNCHTDITIPYDELGEISVVTDEEEVVPIIEEGRFVLAGCEDLNKPLEEYSCIRT